MQCLQQRLLTVRFRHGQAKSNASVQDSRQEALLLLFIAEVDEWWGSNAISTGQPPDHAQVSATSHFIQDDQIVEAIPLIRCYVCRETNPVQIVGWHRVDCGGHVALTAMLSQNLSLGCFVSNASAVQLKETHLRRYRTLSFPLFAKWQNVLVDVPPHLLLQASVRLFVVRRDSATMPQRLREWNIVENVFGR
jgi:hypothetical protein